MPTTRIFLRSYFPAAFGSSVDPEQKYTRQNELRSIVPQLSRASHVKTGETNVKAGREDGESIGDEVELIQRDAIPAFIWREEVS